MNFQENSDTENKNNFENQFDIKKDNKESESNLFSQANEFGKIFLKFYLDF